jgi:hypothetical protein
MGRADELRAELRVLELEERLVEAKEKAKPEDLQKAKAALREARREHRTLRAAAPPEASAGDATVRPAPVRARSSVKQPGGKG